MFQYRAPRDVEPNKDLDLAINKLSLSGANEKCSHLEGQFLSSIFLTPKADGSLRFILNLKEFNIFVKKEHFKIEDLRTAINLLNNGDFMCRLDLKDAHLLVAMDKDSRKYPRFRYREQIY